MNLLSPNAREARASADPTADRKSRLEEVRERLTQGTVHPSRDFDRIAALPRRPRPDMQRLIQEMTQRLKRPEGTQVLREMQAWALYEGPQRGGLFGHIPLGAGKSLTDLLMPMVWPNCRRAVLLIPPKLRVQLLEHDWDFYGRHWVLPNLAGGRFFVPGRPSLHVVAYSELSGTNNSTLLDQIQPDLIVCDEVHALRNYTAARVKRFFRYLAAHTNVSLCGWSGTITSNSIRDYAFLCAVMLGDGSPVPFNEPALGEWAAALDPGDRLIDPGVLRYLCQPGEDVRAGYRRRFMETPGIVAGEAEAFGTELTFIEKTHPTVPENIKKCLATARAKTDPKRPDGEILLTPLDVTRCLRQLACGFYSFWKYPRGEPPELIREWFMKRQHWNHELREKLKDSLPHLDSPKLCENAAERWLRGGCTGCDRGPKQDHRSGCKEAETHPLWDSYTWPNWREIKNRVYHETDTKWESDFLLKEVAKWASENTGLIWVEFVEVGHKLSQMLKIPYYGEGEAAARGIKDEKGNRSCVLSIRANSEGLNLQDRFYKNLYVPLISDAKTLGQSVGRTHRPGQVQDEVFVWYFAHTRELQDGVISAQAKAEYATGTTPAEHKLSEGTWTKESDVIGTAGTQGKRKGKG